MMHGLLALALVIVCFCLLFAWVLWSENVDDEVIYEHKGLNHWVVMSSGFGSYQLYMDWQFQNEFMSLAAAIEWIEGCEA